MMCKDLPDYQGSFVPICQMDKEEETKTFKHQVAKFMVAIRSVRITSQLAGNSLE